MHQSECDRVSRAGTRLTSDKSIRAGARSSISVRRFSRIEPLVGGASTRASVLLPLSCSFSPIVHKCMLAIARMRRIHTRRSTYVRFTL